MEVTWFSTLKEGKAKSQRHQDHVTVLFDWEDVVHHEYASLGQTINKKFYLDVLRWLTDAIQ